MEKIKEINLFKLLVASLFCLLPISYIIGNLVFELNVILIIINFFFSIDKKKFSEIFDKKEFILFLILLIYLQFNTIVSDDWQTSFRRNFFFFRFYLLIISFRYFLVNNYFNSKIIYSWILVIFITTFDIFYEYINGYNLLGYNSNFTHRIASFFKDELIVGSFIFAFTIPIFSFLYIKKKYLFSVLFLIVTFISIILSGERSIFFKMIIALMIIFYFWEYKIYYKKYLALFFITILSFSFLYIPIEKVFVNKVDRYFLSIKRVISYNENYTVKQNLLGTKYINQGVITYEILKENPILGVGNKNYFKSCQKYMNENEKKYCFTHAHQIYYEFLSEHGILGTFLILIILFQLIFNNHKNIKNKMDKKKLFMFGIYLYISLLPLLPSGSFFSSNTSNLFWLNYTFYTFFRDLLIKNRI